MFLFQIICLATPSQKLGFTGITEDSMSKNNMQMVIPFDNEASADVLKCVSSMKLGIKNERHEEMAKIVSFYYDEIKKHTRPDLHSFLLYFTTLICSIVYSDSTEDFKKYRPELLFNLIIFGRFLNMYKSCSSLNSCFTGVVWWFHMEKKEAWYNYENIVLRDALNEISTALCKSNDERDGLDLKILQNIDVEKDDINNTDFIEFVASYVSSATFEGLFAFFLTLKFRFFDANRYVKYGIKAEFNRCIINIDKSFKSDLNATDEYIRREVYKEIDLMYYKRIITHIFNPFVKNIFKK